MTAAFPRRVRRSLRTGAPPSFLSLQIQAARAVAVGKRSVEANALVTLADMVLAFRGAVRSGDAEAARNAHRALLAAVGVEIKPASSGPPRCACGRNVGQKGATCATCEAAP